MQRRLLSVGRQHERRRTLHRRHKAFPEDEQISHVLARNIAWRIDVHGRQDGRQHEPLEYQDLAVGTANGFACSVTSAVEPDIHREAAVREAPAGTGDQFDLVARERRESEQTVMCRIDVDRLLATQFEEAQSAPRKSPRPTMEVIDQTEAPAVAGGEFAAGESVDVRLIEAAIAMRDQLDLRALRGRVAHAEGGLEIGLQGQRLLAQDFGERTQVLQHR